MGAEFFGPLPLAAVALLALNDRFLKPLFANEITGKLSDVAICFFLPLYLSALFGLALRWRLERRLLAGAVLGGVVFAALEMSDVVGTWFCRLLPLVRAPFGVHGAVLTRDPTDLFCLAFVPLAWWYGLRWGRDCPPPPPAPVAAKLMERS
jgi:hypothetical protein